MRTSGPMSHKLPMLLAGLIFAASAQQPSPNFTGNITRLQENPPGQITYIRFDAGARTKWHIHEKGHWSLSKRAWLWLRKRAVPSSNYTRARSSGVLRVWRTGTARRRTKPALSTT